MEMVEIELSVIGLPYHKNNAILIIFRWLSNPPTSSKVVINTGEHLK